MKALFLGFAMTPYFRDFLNRLNSVGNMAVTNIRPQGENRNIGAGVFEEFSGIAFSDQQFPEVEVPQRRLLGLSDFEWRPAYKTFSGLEAFLSSHAPDVIVVAVVHHALFRYDGKVIAAVRKIGARVVFHSIPFGLEPFEERIGKLPQQSRLRLQRFPALGKLIRATGLDLLYLKRVRQRALTRAAFEARRIYGFADAHAVYHEGGISIYGSYGLPDEKIFVVRNSPNTEALSAAAARHLPVPGHPPRLLHMGRLVGWKRVDLLIRAVARLRARGFPDLDLVIVGYGPCEAELRALAEELEIVNSVQFLGGVYDPDELAKQASLTSIYVLAGMGGLSINEAMCLGLPVVCSRCDGTETFLVRDGENGLYFREGDLEDLVRKIADVLGNEPRRLSMGFRSRKIIEQEINTEIHVNNYLAMFERVLGQPVARYRPGIATS